MYIYYILLNSPLYTVCGWMWILPGGGLQSQILLQYTQQNNPSLFLSLHVPLAGLSSDCWTRCLQCCRLEKYLSFSSGMRRGNTESNGQMGSDKHTYAHKAWLQSGIGFTWHACKGTENLQMQHVQNMQDTGVHSAARLTDTLMRSIGKKKNVCWTPVHSCFNMRSGEYKKVLGFMVWLRNALKGGTVMKWLTPSTHGEQVQTCQAFLCGVCMSACSHAAASSHHLKTWRCMFNEWMNIHLDSCIR